jgi:hypothetical protein
MKFRQGTKQTHVALRPIGLMLTIPFLNSMKVPLHIQSVNIGKIMMGFRVTNRLIGMSRSAM